MANSIELVKPETATRPGEAKKAKLVAKAAALAGASVDAVERPDAERVVGEFYRHVPAADVAERSPRDLAGAALSLWRFAARRRPGQAKIRVYNPEPATDGWASPHTIVEIANDDMAFLVDSVTGAINADGRVVNLVIHPILKVVRGADGRLSGLPEDHAEGLRESWMQIEVTREADPSGLAQLTRKLDAVLVDVRAVVEDWQPMRRVLHALRAELATPPAPPVPPEELAEVREFLRWLDDDNLTFLGFREYVFDGAA
ncbi:MAG TPA: NAD-glutamate dehydrogenase, partial [Stellaceae bacterium]|nr:NAD-glutamate dehydrogenase [Stellaceae bacterium]